MTTPPPRERQVLCVNCLYQFIWNGDTISRLGENGDFEDLSLSEAHFSQRAFLMKDSFIECPNTDVPTHRIPIEFALYEPPVIIGFVGDTHAGKTCLLASMAGEIEGNKLRQYGLLKGAANEARHQDYLRQLVRPLFEERVAPPRTGITDFVQYADAVLLRTVNSNRIFPLVLFDIAGESLRGYQESATAVRFLNAVSALIFVVDPDRFDRPMGDPTFGPATSSLRWAIEPGGGSRLQVPAALAVTKSDLLRFEPPVDRWMIDPPSSARLLDGEQVYAQSRDVYAFLRDRGADVWLEPVDAYERTTLHFVSATGVAFDPKEKLFARQVRPRRVLEPLVSVLAMKGFLDAEFVRGRIGY
ncbi:hypothetical protein I6A84_36330 [Frankia sp. CNm7]|uniref:Double-GTPase 2 domain-containing protein n=1 Tax=Frankia nepalensis TaxID=1836974 RepID=A0A937RB38_9ACTN|nr:hypothetical protein [Frankia nepalensis]MBL7494713.1 hypothetical protein [Frankia nepalensis]MBL7514134.1 hypothetical protein [Frankia nepalensis]MBL7523380.1 hypothetical protein [Frankia nepalensis]MBL7626502.1 hypothetical protein [Frankia nepalensis]